MSQKVSVFHIEIVQGVPEFFVSDEIICTHFILTHETHGVHCTAHNSSALESLCLLSDIYKMCKDLYTLYFSTDTQYICDCRVIVTNATFYAPPYHLHQKYYVYFWILKRCPNMLYIVLRVCERMRLMVFNRLMLCMKERYISESF